MAPFVRTVKTASGARAVQIVYSRRGTRRDLEHVGSAHTDAEYEALLQVAKERLAAGQPELDLGLTTPAAVAPITSSRMGVLWDLLNHAYDRLGFDRVTGSEDRGVFRGLVLARILEPTSKLDSERVLTEAGIQAPSYATVKRRLPVYAEPIFREGLSAANADRVGLGPTSLVLYDVTTLYFETDQGDGFREPGYSKERRLEPQITLGLLTDRTGFPLMVEAFEGNKGETTTMLPVLEAFMRVHDLTDVVVVADAGMVSERNKDAIERAGLSFIIGAKVTEVPRPIQQWRDAHPGEEIPDGMIFTQRRLVGPAGKKREQMFHYRFRADYARRTLRGIDEQVAKAERVVAGERGVHKNRYVTIAGAVKSVNGALVKKRRDIAGIKGYVTNLLEMPAAEVVAAYHQLWQIEKSFRMSKHDLRARPIYHRKRDSIDAHLSVVFAALSVSRWLESRSGWTMKRLVKTLRRYRVVEIEVGGQTITAQDPLPPEISELVVRVMHET